MKKTLTKKLDGFTIIEVVLVLAIAGLIFLMVFVALPALQANQADGQRRSDAGRFISQLENYKTNTRGNIPQTTSEVSSFITNYMKVNNGTFADPKAGDYTQATPSDLSAESLTAPELGKFYYIVGYVCSTNGQGVTKAGSRQVAVVFPLSTGVYCANN